MDELSAVKSGFQLGEVKFYQERKGFGFIIPLGDGAKKDVFVHATNLAKRNINALVAGTKVGYKAAHGPKGTFAEDIVIIEQE